MFREEMIVPAAHVFTKSGIDMTIKCLDRQWLTLTLWLYFIANNTFLSLVESILIFQRNLESFFHAQSLLGFK